ncbi:FCP1 domain-containing protein [Citrus sinensis]|uniref:FCP1 domain-containing protein n=3 Tax=Citrus TaxID=2706 RepID=A0ACB8IBR4_CITSI|nr:FCP1 domain-containing protein [Citrus sinensis]
MDIRKALFPFVLFIKIQTFSQSPTISLSFTLLHSGHNSDELLSDIKWFDGKAATMNSLNEIFGTNESDHFSSLSAELFGKSAEDPVCSHEEINFGTIFDLDLRWPCHEGKNVGQGTCEDILPIDKTLCNPHHELFSYSIQQTSLLDQGSNMQSCLGIADEEYYNPYLYFMGWQNLPQIAPSYWPRSPLREPIAGLPITLVLDLDETLVHSSFDNCKDADFSFPIHSKMEVQTVFVRQRPYLHMFLEAVASMFDVVIFTAGQSIYAGQLLDILDPNQTLIGQRVYRDSCVFADGEYLKDLTILGRDLARIAIVDNTPQVFQLQVDNGIPIESWFGDPSDSALLSLLMFLETLVGADDVRPIIKQKYGSQE